MGFVSAFLFALKLFVTGLFEYSNFSSNTYPFTNMGHSSSTYGERYHLANDESKFMGELLVVTDEEVITILAHKEKLKSGGSPFLGDYRNNSIIRYLFLIAGLVLIFVVVKKIRQDKFVKVDEYSTPPV